MACPVRGRASGEPELPASPVRTVAATRAIEEFGDRLRERWASWGSRSHEDAEAAVEEAVGRELAHEVGEQSNDAEQPNDTERSSDTGPAYSAAPRDLGTMDVFNRSFDVMASLITRHRMASNPPDVLVTVPSDAIRTMDFHRAAEMIDLGRRLTIEAMDAAGR